MLGGLYGQISFGFLQGESYEYIGSHQFLKDVLGGLQCTEGDEGVPTVCEQKGEENEVRTCLHPSGPI